MTIAFSTPSICRELTFDNMADATVNLATSLMTEGQVVGSRGDQLTREATGVCFTITNPTQRLQLLPHRNANPFAMIAESLWVLAGRNDIEWLSTYLPRAGDFSDDGQTWRAGYGPRLRKWHGATDQLAEVIRLLRQDVTTRRAVISLWDPSEDTADSKDIPCNNWLHFLVRDNQLHLHVAVRSLDLFWGFSGINCYTWSMVQEFVARSLGVEVGPMTWFVGSLHLYQRHWERAEKMVDEVVHDSIDTKGYGFGTPPIEVSGMNSLNDVLDDCFVWERYYRHKTVQRDLPHIHDPFFASCIQMLGMYHKPNHDGLADLPPGWQDVAEEYERRVWLPDIKLQVYVPPLPTPWTAERLLDTLVRLQTAKAQAYGDSWKRHGELLSIFANITRKVDRLRTDGTTADESQIDTLADLTVYSMLYLTWLAEKEPVPFLRVAKQDMPRVPGAGHFTIRPGYNGVAAVGSLVEATRYRYGPPTSWMDTINTTFNWLERCLVPTDQSYQMDANTKVSMVLQMAVAGVTGLLEMPSGALDSWASQWEEGDK